MRGTSEAPPSALDDPTFGFCHRPGADAEEVQAWCALLDDQAAARCPGFEETCRDGAKGAARPPSGCDETDPQQVAQEPVVPPQPLGCDDLAGVEGMEALAQWLMAILVPVLIAILAVMILRTVGRRRREARRPPTVAPPGMADDALPDVPNMPSDDLLAAAREAMSRGELGQAVLLARGAALRRLGEARKLRLHRARTDREYVRALRRDPESQQALRVVVGAVEHHRWGGDPLEPPVAQRALEAAARLVGASAALLLVLLGLSPVASAQGVSRFGPSGDVALREVLELHGYDAGWRLSDLAAVDDTVDALFLDTSAVHPAAPQWEALREWVEAGGVLVLAGPPSSDDEAVWSSFPELGARVALEPPRGVVRADRIGTDLPVPVWPEGVTAAYTGGRPWVLAVDGDDVLGAAVADADVGRGVVVGIADPRLLWNASFVREQNERFVGDLLYLGQSRFGWPLPTPARVQLATSAAIAPSGGANPFEAVANANLGLFVFQLLLAWALVALWRGWPFAPLRDPPREGRQSFLEHIEALGTRWYRLGASRHALVQMARLWLGRLGPDGLQLAAQRAGMSREHAEAWVADIQALEDSPQGPNHPSDLKRMEELWKVTRRRG